MSNLTTEERARNLVSLDAIPRAVLPDGDGRAALVRLGIRGQNVYAYLSASGGGDGLWNLWLQPLADARPGGAGRVSVAEWAINWEQLVAEMERGKRGRAR
jgi:hypothetical protein